MAMTRFSIAVTLLMAFYACTSAVTEGDSAMLRVETDESGYVAGDTVRLTLTSLSDRPFSYNICFETVLERQVNAQWSSVDAPPGQPPCQAGLFELAAGADATGSFLLPSDLAPGIYRYRVDAVYESDASTRLPEPLRLSNTFEVNDR